MERITSNVSFYCRESKKNRQGLAPVEMCVVLNKKRNYIQLPRKEYPEEFRKALKSKKRNDLKVFLDSTRSRLNEITTSLLMEGRPLTAGLLKHYFKNGGYIVYTVGDLFDDSLRSKNKFTTQT